MGIKKRIYIIIMIICTFISGCSTQQLIHVLEYLDEDSFVEEIDNSIDEVINRYADAISGIDGILDEFMDGKKGKNSSGVKSDKSKNFGKQKIQGVNIWDSGDISITFKLPDGMTLEQALGTGIGDVTQTSVNGEYVIRSANTNNGGKLYWTSGKFYEYYPNGTSKLVMKLTGTDSPFNPEDTELLKDIYGVQIYLDGSRPTKNLTASGEKEQASDFQRLQISNWTKDYGFLDGHCIVSGKIIDTKGTMIKPPGMHVLNFCNGAAPISIDDKKHADALIDYDGNVMWSVKVNGWEEAEKYFDSGIVKNIEIAFSMDTSSIYDYHLYNGYLPVRFELESYEFSGLSYGILDSKGNWVIEPGQRSNYSHVVLGDYSMIVDRYIIHYETGEIFDFGNEFEKLDSKKNALPDIMSDQYHKIEEDGYYQEHNGLKYNGSSGFCDQAGNLVIDLSSKYNLNGHEQYEFVDGYALLDLKNNQNSEYITVIDTDGKQMFEPKRCNTYNHEELSEGCFFVKNGGNGYFMDVYGNKVGGYVGDDYVRFSEGYGWIHTDEGWICIDKNGNKAF